MADQLITKQELIDAQTDVQDLEEVINGEPGKLIKTRLGRMVYTLASIPQINTMTREEVTSALAPKANDAEVYKKTETLTREETNALVAPKANQADVDSAISGMNSTLNTSLANLSTDANKFYPTLPEANAAIASIAVNQPVTIGETANGGIWYKATVGATSLTKSPYDPTSVAAADATIKAKAAEVNAKNFSKQLNKGSLKQGEVQQQGIGLLLADRRGIPNWLQADEQGMPTEFTKGAITNFLNNRLLHQIQNNVSGFVISDRRGFAVFDPENYSQSASSKYDLSTVKFHGTSTIRRMQQELFSKLQDVYPSITNAVYDETPRGTQIADLATRMGINNGSLNFTDNKIYASQASPVTSVDLKYGIPFAGGAMVKLSNGIYGLLDKGAFKAENLSSDLVLPSGLEISFESEFMHYSNGVNILNVGKHNVVGSSASVSLIVNLTRDAVSFFDKESGGHTLVIGHLTNSDSIQTTIQNIKDINASLKALYLNRYFDLWGYIFGEQVWMDTGLTKTSEDIAAISAETLPPSLTNDGIHLNSIANSAVTTKIVQFIQTLGWY